ncbi:MAG: hypothetical protein GXO76_04685 [Calditrichaeota bacterium]|nr:hypothetical protein [Calditrichota bacterium]
MNNRKLLPGLGMVILLGVFLLTGCYTRPKGFHEIFAKKDVTHIGIIEHAPAANSAFANYHFLGPGWANSLDMFSPYWDESFYGMSNYYYLLAMGYGTPYSLAGYGFSPYGWYNPYFGWYTPFDFFAFQNLNGEKIVFKEPVWGASPNRRASGNRPSKSRIRKQTRTQTIPMAAEDFIHPEVEWETVSIKHQTVRDALPAKRGALSMRVKPMKVFINDVIPDIKTPPLVPRSPFLYERTRASRQTGTLLESPATESSFPSYSRVIGRRTGFSSYSRSRSSSHSSSARVRKNNKR